VLGEGKVTGYCMKRQGKEIQGWFRSRVWTLVYDREVVGYWGGVGAFFFRKRASRGVFWDSSWPLEGRTIGEAGRTGHHMPSLKQKQSTTK